MAVLTSWIAEHRRRRREGPAREGRRSTTDDRGDVTILAAGIVLILFIAIGLVADGGGLMRARDDARAAAEQAARVASQELLASGTIDGYGASVNPERAARAAINAAAARGYDAEVNVVDGELVLTTHGEFHTTFWRIVGIRNVSVQGDAQVRLAESSS